MRDEIWTLDISVENTKRCKLSYIAFGYKLYDYDLIVNV